MPGITHLEALCGATLFALSWRVGAHCNVHKCMHTIFDASQAGITTIISLRNRVIVHIYKREEY